MASVPLLITGHEQTQKTRFAIFISLMWSLLPKDLAIIRTYLSLLQLVLYCVAPVKHLLYIIIVQIIFSGPVGSLSSVLSI